MSARIAAGTSVHGRRAAMVASAVCAIAAIPTLVLLVL
jgi:predicted alpha/beta-hydrolase family hydrolase